MINVIMIIAVILGLLLMLMFCLELCALILSGRVDRETEHRNDINNKKIKDGGKDREG